MTWGFSFQLFQFNFSRIFTTWHFELEKFELRHKKKIKTWSFETSDAILSFRFDVSNTVWIRVKPVVENRPKVVELFLTLLLICQTCDPRGHVIATTTAKKLSQLILDFRFPCNAFQLLKYFWVQHNVQKRIKINIK